MAGWFSKKNAFDPKQLAKLFDGYELPNFPAAVMDVLHILRDENSSNADVAHALQLDPGMSVRLIRAVNSSAFGLRQSVEDVEQAIQLMGRSSVESMLIAAAVGTTLPLERSPGFDPRAFWRTAGLRAAVAGTLAEQLCRSERSLCWTAALLQDLAIPLLIESVGKPYGETLERARDGSDPLHVLEREAFGWDHAEIGAAICAKWDFPERLTAAIAGHHDMSDPEPSAPIPVLLVATLEARKDDPDTTDLLAAAEERFGLDPSMVSDAVTAGLDAGEQFTALVSA